MGRARLYIAAKAPIPGAVKTRLATKVGQDRATRLYEGFLQDLAHRFSAPGLPFEVGWYVTPDDAWPAIQRVIGAQDWAAILPQGEGDWTIRQDRLFARAAQRGEERTVLIASDSPHLDVRTIQLALEHLENSDVVLAPVLDGGYSLVGMRGWHDVLLGVPMSTTSVVAGILRRAHKAGVSVAMLPVTFDVDEIEDVGLLAEAADQQSDLRHTRAALETCSFGAAPSAETYRSGVSGSAESGWRLDR